MKKKLLWIAACLLSVTMLIACNGDGGDGSETESTTVSETESESETDTTDTAGDVTTAPEAETTVETEVETETETETEFVIEIDPVNQFLGEQLATLTNSTMVESLTLSEDGTYVTMRPAGADPNYYPFANTMGGRYIVIKYRAFNAEGTRVQLYIASSGLAPSNDNSMLSTPTISDGKWQLAVFDTKPLIDAGIYDGMWVSYFRFDPLECDYILDASGNPQQVGDVWLRNEMPVNASIDVASIAFYNDDPLNPGSNPGGDEDEPTGSNSITIAGVDISEFTVVTPAGMPGGQLQAVNHFISLIERATGHRLPMTNSTANVEHAIVIGGSPANQTVATAISEIKNDGYSHVVKDGNLYITATTGRGVVYGVYDFLEKYAGVRFYTQTFTHVRSIDPVVLDEGMKIVFSPVLGARWIWTQNLVDADNLNWYHVQAHNNNLNQNRWNMGDNDTIYTNSNHTIGILLGEPIPDGQALPCMTDENVYQRIKASVMGQLAGNPNVNAVQVGQLDGFGYCECANCKAIMDANGGMGMASFLYFLNKLAADVSLTYPDVSVIAYAYFDTHKVPTNMEVHDNVIINFCLDNACYQHALTDPTCEKNVAVANELRAWAELCKNGNIYIYNYAWNWNYNINGTGIDPNLFNLWDDFQFYLECGATGILCEGIHCNGGDFDHLRYYLLSRLIWNPQMTKEEYLTIMDEFLEDYYGDAAPQMKAYIKTLYSDERMQNCTSWNFDNGLYFSPEEARQMYEMFRSALELETLSDEERMHVEYSSMHLILYLSQHLQSGSREFRSLWNQYRKTHTLLPWGY